jgi:hypothetical protein
VLIHVRHRHLVRDAAAGAPVDGHRRGADPADRAITGGPGSRPTIVAATTWASCRISAAT